MSCNESLNWDMNWDTHINNITSKANKIIGFLRRNLPIQNTETKTLAYKSMVSSASVWSPHTELQCFIKSPTTLLQWIQNFTLLLNPISVQETITHYNIKLYPPGQTIINTVFSHIQ